MAKIKSLTIQNYRSIKEPLTIQFKEKVPIILIGENNSGKSNILRCLDIMFGEWHPKYRQFDDHDYFDREPKNIISIKVDVEGYKNRLGKNSENECKGFKLSVKKGEENKYFAIQNDGYENQYISNELREELIAITFSSEQSLSYQLSYINKNTLLSRLTKTFHDKLVENDEIVKRLKGLYEQIVTIFDEVKGFRDFKKSMSTLTGELIQNMTYGLQLDFSNYDPSNYFKNLNVMPNENGVIRNFEELGSGQQQLLALSFANAYARYMKDHSNLLLIFDEPETHLHPLAQKWLAKTIYNMLNDGIQIVISTHSPYFINLEYLEGIYVVRKNENRTYVKSTSKKDFTEYCKKNNATKIREETIIPFYSKSATPHILKGFFAKKVILVEGMTEELALPIYLEKIGLDLLKEGIDIINVGGKGELAKWFRLFTHYGIPVYVIFDNDAIDDSNCDKRKDFLKTIGINDQEIEKLISIKNWNIKEKFCIFGKDFEETLRNTFTNYKDLENKVKKEIGDSKPLVAREVAKQIEETEIINSEFKKLKDIILSLTLNNEIIKDENNFNDVNIDTEIDDFFNNI